MKSKRYLSLIVLFTILFTACTTPPASPTATNVPSGTPTSPPTETTLPTATTTPTASSTPTLEPTATPEPTPTSENIVDIVESFIAEANYPAVVEVLEKVVETGEYSMPEAIIKFLLPIIREQSTYSDYAFGRVISEIAAVEVNQAGQLQLVDNQGRVVIEKNPPGTSNIDWAIALWRMAYGIEEVGIIDGEEVNEKEMMEHEFEKWKFGPDTTPDKDGLYNRYFVLDLELQLPTTFKIPFGDDFIEISTLAPIYFKDAQGVQQLVYAPFFSHDAQRKIWHIIDGGTGQTDSKEQFEEWMAAYRRGALDKGLGPMTIAGRPNLNPGQIMFLGFGMEANPLLSSGAKDFFGGAMDSFYTLEQLKEFAQTGDPSGLPKVPGYGPLLISLDEGDRHILTKLQDNQLTKEP